MIVRPVYVLFICCFFVIHQPTIKAQQASNLKTEHSPKKATLLSIIPGGGQIYNKKYWKVPIIYAGFAILVYSASFNQKEFNRFKTAYSQNIKNEPITDPELVNVPPQMLQNARDYYQKNRDLSYIGMAGLYALNLIDAAVDAHLKQFDVSDNLSFIIKPSVQYRQNMFATTVMLQFFFH